MANQIYPCIWFDGQAQEAAELYCSVFENSKILNADPMLVSFEICGKIVVGLNGGPMFKINPSISFFIYCPTLQETDAVWDKLLAGGSALIPIGAYPWGERYGWLTDKYGMTWQIMLNQDISHKMMYPSFLFTGKQFGRGGEAIEYYSSIFKNSQTDTLVPYPEGDENAGKVMYAEFQLDHYPLIAMDGPGEHGYSFNEAVSFVVECENQEEIDNFWNEFTNEGKESMCGWCSDKFGVSWQVIPAILKELMNHPEKGKKVQETFLKMKKFDIAALLSI
jgi:predicted 3-demethylubiquinone-9 3-methyltransferase (glyoxalase superfamily)